jgi:hypothetical protein
MKYKILIPVFVLASATLFYACSKNDSNTPVKPADDPVKESYQPGNTLIIDQLAIYTSNGIVTDPSVIQTYLSQHFSSADAQKFHVNESFVGYPGINITLDFLTQNRVRLNDRTMEIVSITDNQITVAEYDSTEVPAVDPSSCGVLLQKVPFYTAQNDCPSNNCTKYRKTYPIIVSNGTYFLPILHFAVSTSGIEYENGNAVDTKCSRVSQEYPMVNILNPELANSLTENDSVLVQIGRLPMMGGKRS